MRIVRRLVCFVTVAAAVLAAAACDMDTVMYGPGADLAKAEERVTGVLEGMRAGGDSTGGDIQEAICRWYNGKLHISDSITLGKAELDFNVWLREKGLYNRKIGSYEIVEAEVVEGVEPMTVRMKIKIDDRPYTIRIPDEEPISWAK